MNFLEATIDKTRPDGKTDVDHLLVHQIGAKLPKKVRKKLRWKKVAPILSIIISLIVHLFDRLGGQARSKQTAPPAPTRARPSEAARSRPVSQERYGNPTLRGYVERAMAYQTEINRLAQNAAGPSEHQRVGDLAAHVRNWTEAITALAGRIDAFQQNKLINQDLKSVPQAIDRLEERLQAESDPVIAAEMERSLSHRRTQLEALEKLQRTIRWAEIKIESTLSLLGTIYSQILAGQSREQVADYRRLLNEIDEEVLTLQDHLQALEEVKFGDTLARQY
jgi:hypothetical protein